MPSALCDRVLLTTLMQTAPRVAEYSVLVRVQVALKY